MCNTLFVGVDGIAVGISTTADPTVADALWSSPWVGGLANLTGIAWSGALLAFAAAHPPPHFGRGQRVGLALTWLSFVGSAVVPGLSLLSRLLAIGVGARSAYDSGQRGVPWAMLVFAAVLRQHVGAEAAFGLGLLGVAFEGLRLTGRSTPAAASLP